jgi:UTP--glucose-1-phosphate uridylyltransferase
MGSAIAVFTDAQAVRVSRARFAPVKTTEDLLAVRSDAYCLTDDFRVIPNPLCHPENLSIELDADFYRFVTELEARFPEGPPSLVACTSLKVEGNFKFGRHIICQGDVYLINESGPQVEVPAGATLQGTYRDDW